MGIQCICGRGYASARDHRCRLCREEGRDPEDRPPADVIVRNTHSYTEKGPDRFYIGRGSPLGNPFSITPTASRSQVIEWYETWLKSQIKNGDRSIINELNRITNHVLDGRPANLVCFCAPKPCHGDVLKRLICEAIKDAYSS